MIAGGPIAKIFGVKVAGRYVAPDTGPSAVLIRNGVASAVPVSITANADGSYLVTATVPTTWEKGDSVYLRVEAMHQGRLLQNNCFVGVIAEDATDTQNHADIIAMLAQLINNDEMAAKLCKNRTKFDPDTQILTVYDDDGTTPLCQWTLKTAGGEPVASPYGVQAERCPL